MTTLFMFLLYQLREDNDKGSLEFIVQVILLILLMSLVFWVISGGH